MAGDGIVVDLFSPNTTFMKKILVPTDYSEQARNAVNHAMKLAENFKSSIYLFHAFHVPVPTMESTILLSLDDIEAENEQRLKKEAARIKQEYSSAIPIETISRVGFAEEAIITTGEEEKTDLIIMGSEGASGLEEVFVGTNTAGVIERTTCPVMCVPVDFEFRIPKNIVFAYDYHEIKDKSELQLMFDLALKFNSTIQILHIDHPDEDTDVKKAASGVRLEHLFEGIKHELFFMQSETIEDAILDFIKQKQSDMVVMMPHKHGFFSRLFHTSNTVKMSFHTPVPLLCLPAKN